jgi:ABC-type branched-subunit amino acid transport system permease subunit
MPSAISWIVGYAGLVSLGHAALFAISGYAVGIAMSTGFGHRGSLNSAHIHGTQVPVEEPSTASNSEVAAF